MSDTNRLLEQVSEDVRRSLPKHARLKLELRERLQRMAAGEALPSIAALRAEFGVSQGPVDRALRDLQQEGLIAVRHGSGVYATGGQHLMHIALYFSFDVLAPEAGVFPRLLLKGLEAAAGVFEDVQYRHYFAAGTGVLWHNRVCALEQDVRRRLVDGVISMGVYGGELGDLPVPVVALNAPPGVKAHVALDHEALIRLALEALKAKGCRHVGLLGPRPDTLPPPDDNQYETVLVNRQRVAFFQKEAKRLGLTSRPEWCHGVSGGGGIDEVVPAGRRAFTELWNARAAKPDGLVCTDDYVASGALRAMREMGVVPGRDVQVASHANLGSPVLAGEPVVKIEFDPAAVARALVQTVHDLVAGRHEVPGSVLVAPHAVIGPEQNGTASPTETGGAP